MTQYIALFFFIVLLCYVGQTVGLLRLCDNTKYLHKVKKFVFIVPFLSIILFFMLLIDSFKKCEVKILLFYLFMEEKSVFILANFAQAKETVEAKEKKPTQKIVKNNIRVMDTIRSVKDSLPIAAVI